MRELAITFLLVVNLANFGAKIYLDPEPPIQAIIAEVLNDKQLPDATAPSLVFVSGGFGSGFEPGTASPTTGVGRYFLSLHLDPPLDPPTFRGFGGQATGFFLPMRTNVSNNAIRAALARRPNATELIYWQATDWQSFGRFFRGGTFNPFPTAAGPGWKFDSTQKFQAYDHWTWKPLGAVHRHVYIKGPTPPPPPIPTPTKTTTRPTPRAAPNATTRTTTRPAIRSTIR